MTHNEIARVQDWLRKTFANNKIRLVPPGKPDRPVEITIDDEFIGTVYREEDEGEVSYPLNICILEEDLPPAGAVE